MKDDAVATGADEFCIIVNDDVCAGSRGKDCAVECEGNDGAWDAGTRVACTGSCETEDVAAAKFAGDDGTGTERVKGPDTALECE